MRIRGLGIAAALLTLMAVPTALAQDTVYFSDLAAFAPREAVSTDPIYGKWYLRHVDWEEHSKMVLNLAGTAAVPDLTCTPGLQGRYNVYVACRQVDWPTVFQLQVGDDPQWYTVDPGLGTPQKHTNRVILVATNVDLTGKRVTLHAVAPSIYFYHLKFAKADTDANAVVDAQAIKREPRRSPGDEAAARVKAGYFIERFHVDDRVPPTPNAAQQQAGFVLFRRHYLDLTFPNTVPAAEEVTDRLELSAAPGEFEPVTFALRALRPLTDVRVTVAELRSPQGASIPAGAIDVRAVRCLRKRSSFYTGAGEFMTLPLILEARPTVAVPADTTKQFWLTVRVPDGAPPGCYTGTVTVAAGEARQMLALVLEVLPIRLPATPPGYSLAMYDTWPSGVTPLAERFRDMREHGMTTVGWCGESGMAFELKDGKAMATVAGSRLATVLAAHAKEFAMPMLWLMSGEISAWCRDQEAHGADYTALYTQIIRQLLDYTKSRGWPGLVFQPEDECPSVVTNFPSANRQLKALKAAGAVTEMDHMAFGYPKRPEIDPLVREAMSLTDVLTLRYSLKPVWYEQTWDELRDLCARHGKILWTYNINDGMALPEPTSNRFSTGYFFHTLGKGCTGEVYWAYQVPFEGLYEDLDGESTDDLWRYPPWPLDGEVGGPTIMWECVREGVDDLRYLEALRALIAQARPTHPAAAAKAQATLDSVLGSFRFDEMGTAGCRYIESKWEKVFTLPDGRRAGSGSFRFPNGWQAQDYDTGRRKIASAIVDLQGAVLPQR